ncbi:MarR family winged helix-turn-helix transcriptional regulator [Phenylobacterium sp. VNQ135]|uniref:MarR family winged helix-turn-helix transcriptional regulator n=1 Tax=Phenylobacterium sp. VNQ135 TaxID=3400922 RepID=UPI003C024D32
MAAQENRKPLLLALLQAFYWCDESLQNYLRSRGWPEVTRPQSMVMSNIVLGVNRPSDIARNMGISRQAIHATINQMVESGVVALADDPVNRRVKIVTPTKLGETMRFDAQQAMVIQTEELIARIGEEDYRHLTRILNRAWGPAVTFGPGLAGSDA